MTDQVQSVNTRGIALKILNDVNQNGNFSHTVMNKTLNQHQSLSKQDRAFITRICEGTLERMITLDYVMNQYSTIKVNKMKPLIRNLLRMSLYQIMYMSQVPDSAVCNEAVKLAKSKGFSNLSGFVNGVLRNITREKEAIAYPLEKDNKLKYLSVTYSMPEWILKVWLEKYEYAVVKEMLVAFLKEKETTIRCNISKITIDELETNLMKEQVKVSSGSYFTQALKIREYNYLSQLESFQKGEFLVQDESSMIVGAVSGAKSGDYVIDVCSAPGGKALHIADQLKGTGFVDARDLTLYKVGLINENIVRTGFKNIKARVFDALVLDKDSVEKADIVVADLPCSGLGVIGKKPDIKYNMTPDKQRDLVKLQREILAVVQNYVKPGGVLLYSTCTINDEENISNAMWFAKEFGYAFENMDEYLPQNLRSETTKNGYIQCIPGLHELDGFFVARLRRIS
ncbi:MAG: 16S rRNA (cytosine(967)-C(5))-methyltransferase RsmB [Anaerocolumna sp.]